MSDESAPHIMQPLVQAIEEAILLGNIKEIDGILELIREEEDFPLDLRYGLEAMMYFRMHYGRGGVKEPENDTDRQKIAQMESYWGRELIQSIGHYPDLTEAKYA